MLSSFRYFLQVSRSGSVRAAGEVLGLAPSSVSRQVQALEQQIGTTLLHRSASGATLTTAGELVADFAQNYVQDYDNLRADLNDLRGKGGINIRIGVIESMVSGPLMRAVIMLRQRYPNVTYSFNMMRAPEIGAAVRAGLCDIGIALDISSTPDLRIIGRVPETMVLALPPGHPLAERATIQLADLVSLPLALHHPDHGVRQMFDRACRAHDLSIKPVLSSNSLEALRDFVRAGGGGAVLTNRGARSDLENGTMIAVMIDNSDLAFEGLTIFASSRRGVPRMVKFCEEGLLKALKQDRG